MGMGFAPTWLRQVSPPPLLHKTTLTTAYTYCCGLEWLNWCTQRAVYWGGHSGATDLVYCGSRWMQFWM